MLTNSAIAGNVTLRATSSGLVVRASIADRLPVAVRATSASRAGGSLVRLENGRHGIIEDGWVTWQVTWLGLRS